VYTSQDIHWLVPGSSAVHPAAGLAEQHLSVQMALCPLLSMLHVYAQLTVLKFKIFCHTHRFINTNVSHHINDMHSSYFLIHELNNIQH